MKDYYEGLHKDCSYEGLGEEINELHSLRTEDKDYGYFTMFPVLGQRLGLLCIISIPISGGQNANELRLQSLNTTQ